MQAILRVHCNKLTLDVEAVELYLQKGLWYDDGTVDYEMELDNVYNSVEDAIHEAHIQGVMHPANIQIEMVGGTSDQETFASYDELIDHEC